MKIIYLLYSFITKKYGCMHITGPWEAVYNASTFKTKSDAFKQAFDALPKPV